MIPRGVEPEKPHTIGAPVHARVETAVAAADGLPALRVEGWGRTARRAEQVAYECPGAAHGGGGPHAEATPGGGRVLPGEAASVLGADPVEHATVLEDHSVVGVYAGDGDRDGRYGLLPGLGVDGSRREYHDQGCGEGESGFDHVAGSLGQ